MEQSFALVSERLRVENPVSCTQLTGPLCAVIRCLSGFSVGLYYILNPAISPATHIEVRLIIRMSRVVPTVNPKTGTLRSRINGFSGGNSDEGGNDKELMYSKL